MQRFTLFTTSYSRFRPGMGEPVQASNGKPRWKLAYDLTYAIREAYPKWSLVKSNLSEEEFTRRYHADLDKVGVDAISSRLRAIAVATGNERLVLLCFEELSKPNNWCHRRMFASWWEAQTGDAVRELGPTGPDDDQAGLLDYQTSLIVDPSTGEIRD